MTPAGYHSGRSYEQILLAMKPIEDMEVHELMALDMGRLGVCELETCVARLAEINRKNIGQIIEDETLGHQEYIGFIYALSNPSMPGLLKIGATEGRVEKRMKELSRPTGVPTPFRCEFHLPVYEILRVAERRVHKHLDQWRDSNYREFFKIDPEAAKILIKEVLVSPKPR